VRQGGPDLAALTTVIWLKRISPIARAQPIDGGSQTRVGFRKLGPPPDAVMRACDMVPLWVQIRQGEVKWPWLRADVRNLIAVTGFRSMAHDSMACDIPAEVAVSDLQITIEPILSKAAPFTEMIGGLQLIGAKEPAPSLMQRDDLQVGTYSVMDGPATPLTCRVFPLATQAPKRSMS
jgi:hypothetical protein